MNDRLLFDVTDSDTRSETHRVGSHLIASDNTLITTGDGDSDNIANTFNAVDMRSFLFGYDSVGDNWDRLQLSGGALKVFIDDGDFEVDVVINAEKAEDSAHGSGDIGNYVLGVRADSRPTNANTDADGDYASFFINTNGELYVHDTDVLAQLVTIDAVLDSIKVDTAAMVVDLAAIEVELLDQGTTLDAIETELLDQGTTLDSIETEIQSLTHAEDAAHVSGDVGIQSLSVRIDDIDSPPAGTLAGTEGDYQSMHTDAKGALWVRLSDEADSALANSSIANAANTLAVASTAEDIIASPLASRKYVYVYNNDNRTMFIGASGVTAANGFPISPGSYLEMRAGASVDIEYVSPKVGHAIRTMELS